METTKSRTLKDSEFAVIKATELCNEFQYQLGLSDIVGSRKWHRMIYQILDELDTPEANRPLDSYNAYDFISGPELVAGHLSIMGFLTPYHTDVKPTDYAIELCMPREVSLEKSPENSNTIVLLNELFSERSPGRLSIDDPRVIRQIQLGRCSLLPGGVISLTNYGKKFRNYLNQS